MTTTKTIEPSSPRTWKSLAIRAMELLIGFAMIISSWLHLKNHMMFYLHVAGYKILPVSVLQLFSLTLPWLMLFTGMSIISRVSEPVGSLVGATLFFLFGIAQAWALINGLSINCGCFGSLFEKEIDVFSMSLPFILAIGCVVIARFRYLELLCKRTLQSPSGAIHPSALLVQKKA